MWSTVLLTIYMQKIHRFTISKLLRNKGISSAMQIFFKKIMALDSLSTDFTKRSTAVFETYESYKNHITSGRP